jgi:hypothetical protein
MLFFFTEDQSCEFCIICLKVAYDNLFVQDDKLSGWLDAQENSRLTFFRRTHLPDNR